MRWGEAKQKGEGGGDSVCLKEAVRVVEGSQSLELCFVRTLTVVWCTLANNVLLTQRLSL